MAQDRPTSTGGTDSHGAALLSRIVSFIDRFIVLRVRHQAIALALWVVHTHAFDAADSTPYPLITSPEKRSGKSRLLEQLRFRRADGMFRASLRRCYFARSRRSAPRCFWMRPTRSSPITPRRLSRSGH